MAFGKENVVVVYRQNDDDSFDFAEQYQAIHDLDADQLIAVPCSNQEILDDYATFQSEVENPLLTALTTSPVTNYSVQAIVVGPYVPGGFNHGSDVVSTTSRLSRIYHVFDKGMKNPLYDRQVFSRYSSSDSDIALICTRFDAPTISIINQWLKNIEQAKRQIFLTGTFYFDAFSGIGGADSSTYTDELVLFSDVLLSSLGLPVVSTSFIDPYIDSLIPSVENDSFYWGWGADRGSLTFFKNSTHIRCFFYNADFDGAYTMRDIDERNWPLLAIRQGYIASAGPLSNPGIDGFLRPRPFFDALFRGATLGEALLFSQPNFDWTMACFGDPLLTFSFPDPADELNLIAENDAWQTMAVRLAQSIIRLYRKSNRIKDLRDEIVLGDDVQTSLDLTYPFDELHDYFQENDWKNDYVNLVNYFISFAILRNKYTFEDYHPSFDDYLTETGNKITDIVLQASLNDEFINDIVEENIEKEGSWIFETTLLHEPGTFAFYHFELDVATDEDFDDIIIRKKSFESLTNWFFEEYDGEFKPIGTNGVTSSYANKRIRYVSQDSDSIDEILVRGEYYYYRFRQKDQLGYGDYRYFTSIVYA